MASLQFVEQLGVDKDVDAQVLAIEQQVRGVALGAYHIWHYPLSGFLDGGIPFTIKRVSEADPKDPGFVRVEFDVLESNISADESVQGSHITYSEAFLVCDPAKAWALTEYGANLHNHRNNEDSVHHVTVETLGNVPGIPVGGRIQREISFPAHPENVRLSVTTIEVNNEAVSDEEFLLSHYGLPEPNFERAAFRPWFTYLIGAAFFAGVGWMLLKRASSRKQTP